MNVKEWDNEITPKARKLIFEKHLEEMFSEVARKINSSEYAIFFGIILFMIKKIFCNVRTKIVNETYFLLMVRANDISSSASVVPLDTWYLSSNICF